MSQLDGLNILLTRPAGQNELWQQALEQSGACCYQLPLIEITSITPAAPIDPTTDWLIFVSPNAVRHGLPLLEDVASKCKVAAVGKATAKLLQQHGIRKVIQPKSEQNSEGLLELAQLQSVSGKNISIVRGNGGRDLLAKTLRERGAAVDFFECYQRSCPTHNEMALKVLEQADSKHQALVILTSNQAIDHWQQSYSQLSEYWQNACYLVIGERQKQHFTSVCQTHNLSHSASAIIAPQADISAIQTSIQGWYNAPFNNKKSLKSPQLTGSESTGNHRRNADMSEQSKQHGSAGTSTDSTPDSKATSAESSATMTDQAVKPSNSTPAQPQPAPAKSGKGGVVLSLAALAVSGALAFGGWQLWQHQQQQAKIAAEEALLIDSKINQLQAQVNRQSSQLTQANQQLASAQQQLEQKQIKTSATLQKVLDVAGRQPNTWAVSEAEYLVQLANRHLELDRDVKSALSLLQAADKRLASLDDPRLLRLRNLLNQDITQLKAVPQPDIEGVVFKLQGLIAQVTQLPLISPEPYSKVEESELEILPVWGAQWWDNLKNNASAVLNKVSQYIVIREYQGDTPALLMPEQRIYLNQNLQLQLRQASLAVLKGQQQIYTQSLNDTEQWIKQYLDANSAQAQAFIETLQQLKQVQLEPDLPQATRAVDELYRAVNGLLDAVPAALPVDQPTETESSTDNNSRLKDIDPNDLPEPKMLKQRLPKVIPPGPDAPDVKTLEKSAAINSSTSEAV